MTKQLNQKQVSILHLIFDCLIVVYVLFCSLKKGLPPKIRESHFVILNSVVFNLWCVLDLISTFIHSPPSHHLPTTPPGPDLTIPVPSAALLSPPVYPLPLSATPSPPLPIPPNPPARPPVPLPW